MFTLSAVWYGMSRTGDVKEIFLGAMKSLLIVISIFCFHASKNNPEHISINAIFQHPPILSDQMSYSELAT